ncbi:hypothetical protein AD951_06500 [Acetobacter malorum]|uniref:Polysaccharide pyruvyl transferase domain-containing protein n=1 Tax=Acetobacter malorum TaxID=178901 RepID=A0A149UNH5_9PROT|nr:polysaccharide pyruvyl transferase family protein [Acetobacter malorum]KXV69472.1 hypothetical protein AD951_06500 [Acetobacter malorum]
MNTTYKNIRKAVCEEIGQHSDLIASLKRFAEHNAVFYPGYGNLGDALIAVGTIDLFEDLGWAPQHVYGNHKHIFSGYSHVVMGGGGGWVKGLREGYIEQTLEFLQDGGQLLILPSSFAGFGAEFVPYANQVTIFCREQQSYDEFLKQGMPEDRIFLCPDLAFYTKEKHFSDLDIKGHYPVLKILRRDEEGICKLSPRDSVDLPLLFNGVQWSKLDECLQPLRAVAGLISQFECVETDRLHMAILSTLMGRIVKLEPSNYFKIKSVFDYTLHRFPTVSFVEHGPDYSHIEQNDYAHVRQLREAIRQLKLDQQAEWAQRAVALRQNDALSSRLEGVQEKLSETSKCLDVLSEEKQNEIRQKEGLTLRIHSLEDELKCKDREFEKVCLEKDGQFERVCQEKDRNFDQICRELAQLNTKKKEELEQVWQELEKIRSSRLHRLGESYYAIFHLPAVGALLRGVRKIILG